MRSLEQEKGDPKNSIGRVTPALGPADRYDDLRPTPRDPKKFVALS